MTMENNGNSSLNGGFFFGKFTNDFGSFNSQKKGKFNWIDPNKVEFQLINDRQVDYELGKMEMLTTDKWGVEQPEKLCRWNQHGGLSDFTNATRNSKCRHSSEHVFHDFPHVAGGSPLSYHDISTINHS